MNGNGKTRRAIDNNAVAVASRTLWDWVERHHVDALAVIIVTLVLTVQVITWAMDFADEHYSEEGLHIAAIIGAVLTPWGITQSFLFKFYADLKNRDYPPTYLVTPSVPAPAPSTIVVTPGAVQDPPTPPQPPGTTKTTTSSVSVSEQPTGAPLPGPDGQAR